MTLAEGGVKREAGRGRCEMTGREREVSVR